jgi:hypothetical protein
VQFSLRPKPVIHVKASPMSPSPDLLAETTQTLYGIVDSKSGIAPLVLQRSLPDVVSGIVEIAFCPSLVSSDVSAKFEKFYTSLIDE